MWRSSRRSTSLLAASLAMLFLSVATAARSAPSESAPPAEGLRLGLMLDPAEVAALPPASGDPDRPAPLVRLVATWAAHDPQPAHYDWTGLAAAVDAAGAAGYRVVLALEGSHPSIAGEIDAWLAFVRSAVREFADRVDVFEIAPAADSGSDGRDPDAVALALKQSALAIRAEAGARPLRIAQQAVGIDDLPWQIELWERDLSAYVDVVPVVVDATDPAALASGMAGFFRERLRHPPAAALWVYARGGERWEAAAAAATGLSSGARIALFAPPAAAVAEEARWAVGLHRTLADGYAPASATGVRVEYPPGQLLVSGVVGQFFNEEDYTTLILYHAPPSASGADPRLVVGTAAVRDARLFDPLSGQSSRTRSARAGGGRRQALRLRASPWPQAAVFQRLAVGAGLDGPSEQLEVAGRRGLTAEEIIARYQQLQQAQDDRLERWTAKGRIDYHFKIAQGGATIDVSIDSTYYQERGGPVEWEQTQYYINGNRVGWKKFPQLPLIQPEKVVTLPLDLTLDRTYGYRLVGEERVDGHDAYVVSFQPTGESDQSLYRGRLWVDKTTFARVRARLIQNNLDPPVISNEEVDRFSEWTGPGGKGYWLYHQIDGQQVWNIGGRTFVVRREVSFNEYTINPPVEEFESARDRSYASDNQMLRETDDGFRYLERFQDGTRQVKPLDSSQFFAAAGAFKDESQDNVVPLAGVNYFDYDLAGRDIQLNVLFAGVIAFVTATKPGLLDGRLDITGDLGLSALKSNDKIFEGEAELLEERVRQRRQRLALRLGFPLGPFFKVNLVGGLTYRQYFQDDDALAARETFNADPMPPLFTDLDFVLPQDHLELSGAIELEFNRRGYSVIGAVTQATRSDWETWGLVDLSAPVPIYGSLDNGVFVPGAPEPVEDGFTRWGLTLFKEWYLPKFQKVRGSVDYLDGSSLDRFSQYSFSFFGEDRLSGFSGSGVRFDEGLIARAGYAFNLFEVIQFDLALESARVRQDDPAAPRQSYSGVGLSGNFVGPWKTVINLNYGYAVASDIPELEGQQEFLLFVFKLF